MIKEDLYNEIILKFEKSFEETNIKVNYRNYKSYFTKSGDFDKRKKGFRIQFLMKREENVINLVESLELFYSKIKAIISNYNSEVFFFEINSSDFKQTSRESVFYSEIYFAGYSFFAKKKLQK